MIEEYFKKYRTKGILVDTNLLLLLYIGGVSKKYISEFKRTNTYTEHDYDLLLRVIDNFSKVVVTPNLLTEVSNLSNGISGQRLKDFYAVFASSLSVIEEKYVPSKDLISHPALYAYGLADTGIAKIAKDNFLILTDDLRFASFASTNGADVINFNHIRDFS